MCLPQTACQDAEEDDDEDDDQVRATAKSGLDRLGRPHRASSGQCAELSLQEPGLLREAGDFQRREMRSLEEVQKALRLGQDWE